MCLREATSSSLNEKPRLACARTGVSVGEEGSLTKEKNRPVGEGRVTRRKVAAREDRRRRTGTRA